MKIAEQLEQMLAKGVTGNQKQLVKAFADMGVTTTQSSISRALKKIDAVKSIDEGGNTIYRLQASAYRQQVASPPSDIFDALVHNIGHNGQLVVVHTKPGMAMTVAKFIDDKKFDQVLGTVAGDDTIMIVPQNVSFTSHVAEGVKVYLGSIGIME